MALTPRDVKNDDTTDAGFDIATDTVASLAADVPVSKLMLGDAGTNDGLVSSANPMPIEGTVTANIGTVGTLLTESDFDTKTGALTETAPATDTASSGLNGRLQRLSQRITSLIGLFPSSIGQKAKAGSLSVTLASDQDTVPISAASLPLPSGAATSANQATANTSLGNIETATEATQTAVELINDAVYTDGTGTPSKGLAVMGTDGTNPQIVSTNSSGHVNIADGGNTITIDGTVGVSGTVTVNGSGVTQPVSAVSLPLPTGASTAANQTTVIGHLDGVETLLGTIDADTSSLAGAVSGSEVQVDVVAALPAGDNAVGRVKLTDGTEVADVLDLTNANPLTVAIVDGDGSQITSFGGGTQYTEGDIDATLTGTIAMAEGPSNTATPLQVDASSHLQVDIAASSATVTVAGAVTANAGTNLNTSALALESGGNLATIAGAVSGTEMQVDIASALPAGTNNIGDVDVLSVAPGTGATNLGKAEDAAHASGDVGVAAMTVRQDTAAALSDTDADYQPLITDASGRLHVNVGASALPTGAATAANQTMIIGHVDGLEGLLTTIDADTGNIATAVQLLDDAVTTLGTDTYTEASSKGLTIGAVRRDADTTLVNTTNEFGPLQMDANGRLKVEAFSGETLPVSLASVPSHAVTNAGTFAVQVDGSALTALQKIDDPVLVDDAAFTPATSSVMMAGFQADEASTDSVDEGDAGAARMTLDRKQIVTPQPHTAGGLSIFRSLDLDETEEEVKGTAGCVYAMWVTNTATTARFIKFYNATAANVTVGSTTPVITIGIPGNATDDIAGNFGPGGMGIMFDTAITVAATTAVADADTGAPGANEIIINVFYK